jgi:hypothetical protein
MDLDKKKKVDFKVDFKDDLANAPTAIMSGVEPLNKE